MSDNDLRGQICRLIEAIDVLTSEFRQVLDSLESIYGHFHFPMSIDETSRYLKLSKSMLYKLMNNGTFIEGKHFIRLGDRRLFINGEELMEKLMESPKGKDRRTLHH